MPTNNMLFRQIAVLLWGARPQTVAAAHLRRSSRTIARWSADETAVPQSIYAQMLHLLIDRRAVIDRMIARLELDALGPMPRQ